MKIQTIFCGGTSDSLRPRKVHISGPDGEPLCGQFFARYENVDGGVMDADDYVGSETCAKCQRKMNMRPNTQVQP